MSVGFTPGPWLYRPNEFDDWGCVRGGDCGDGLLGLICHTRYPHYSEDELAEHRRNKTDPWFANANLIAAAPELFQVAEQFERVAEYELRKMQRDKPEDDEGIRLRQLNLSLIRETLSKARGEQ